MNRERKWFLEPRFNAHGARFNLVGNFINQFDTSTLLDALVRLNRSYSRMVLDCAQMTCIDGHGVADMLRAHLEMAKRGVVLEIIRIRPEFRHKFEQVGVGTQLHLPIHFSEEVSNAERPESAPAP